MKGIGRILTRTYGTGGTYELNGCYPYGALMNTFVDNQGVQPYKYGAELLRRNNIQINTPCTK